MNSNNKITKLQGRKVMFDLLIQREAALPDHLDPVWTHEFWNSRLHGDADIKRVLGVGTATLAEHLRLYKDPFESDAPQYEAILLDVGQSDLPPLLQGGE